MSPRIFSFQPISQNPEALGLKILREDKPMRFWEVIEAWEYDPDFRQFYIDYLKASDFPAAYWEHPALMEAYLETV